MANPEMRNDYEAMMGWERSRRFTEESIGVRMVGSTVEVDQASVFQATKHTMTPEQEMDWFAHTTDYGH